MVLFFSATALIAGIALTAVTYVLARSFLVDQRSSVARTQAFSNAKVVNDQLVADPQFVGDLVARLRTDGAGFALLVTPDGEYLSDNRFSASAIPAGLLRAVDAHRSAEQFFRLDGAPYLAVGVFLGAFDGRYYEAFPLAGTEDTLRTIGTAMALGATIITIFAALAGRLISRRVLQPLTRVSAAAGEIASGGLDARLPTESDPDLAPLTHSFNAMADAVQARIEREERFASDVSHELRSPITALVAAADVLDHRRDELSDRNRQALDLVVTQVHRFEQMVLDLLELSRIDAGATDLRREPVRPLALLGAISQRLGTGARITVDPALPEIVEIDKLRFERIVVNLVDNAEHHAGGATTIHLGPYGDRAIELVVGDEGPGVPESQHTRIFERFTRGGTARHRSGTGLGLALVSEHAAAHGGSAWVESAPGGGARFHVVLEDAR